MNEAALILLEIIPLQAFKYDFETRRGGALGHLAAAAFHCGVCKHARGAHDVHRSAEYNHTNDMSDFQLDRSGISEIQHEYDTN